MSQATDHKQPSKFRRYITPILSNASTSLAILFSVGVATELALPKTFKPSSAIGGFLGRLEASEVAAKDDALVHLEHELARVQRENEIALEAARAEFQEGIERVKADAQKDAQVQIEEAKAEYEQQTKRLEAINTHQTTLATKLIEQSDETSAVKKFGANAADFACFAAIAFEGEDNYGICGAGDMLRADMAQDVGQSVSAFQVDPNNYRGPQEYRDAFRAPYTPQTKPSVTMTVPDQKVEISDNDREKLLLLEAYLEAKPHLNRAEQDILVKTRRLLEGNR